MSEIGNRFHTRDKKRKVNRVLNILIGIVVAIIICVSAGLFFLHKEEAASDQPVVTEPVKEPEKVEEKSVKEEPEKSNQKVIVPNSTDTNVVEAYTNTGWAPIGTKQTEPHVITYDATSQDWKEILEASAYATELTVNDFTPLFVGRGSASDKVLSTIATKDGKYIYRTELQWVKEQGWEPLLVEQLHKFKK